jgi:hypothetical protein
MLCVVCCKTKLLQPFQNNAKQELNCLTAKGGLANSRQSKESIAYAVAAPTG